MLDLLAMLARRWRIVIGLVVVGLLASAGLTQQLTPSYRASTQLFVALDSADSAIELNSAANFSSQRVKSYPDLVDSPLVLDPTIEELGLGITAQELAADVSAEVSPNTVLIEVSVDNASPVLAADIANSVSANLAAVVEELDKTREDRASPVRVSVTREAIAPSSPRTPIPLLNLSIGLLAGLVLGLAFAALREALDTSIKNEADVMETIGLPTLASVPTNPDVSSQPILGHSPAHAVWAESYRKLRTNLSYVDPDNPPKVILVGSALPGDGKSLTAANLAASLAQSGKRTVLVEADLRRPSVGRLLGLVPDVGVTTVVAGKAAISEVTQSCDEFDVITSGPVPPNPSELLGSHAFQAMIEDLRGAYDSVVIDTPPLIAVTDAAVVAVVADAVILVCRAKRTKRNELRRALFGLRAVDANIVGAVLNQVALSSGSYYQYDYRAPGAKAR
ncbi:polysaccharide biosynthesis tyrosine autokinase [Nocardioides psychrotolerans]|uniref:polysaccharide biosynthesis tyrosine autokinase n=1 Tax=Nocardioides psychrotolerans TaxID=1005945 RepID=UPI0031378E35